MLWRALYGLATWLALPWVLAYFAWRGRREPAYRHHWGERLGRLARCDDAPLWIHAASVGETILAAQLIEQLDARLPVLVTTMTPTGRAEARRRLPANVRVAYVPLDTCAATRRFMTRVGPRAGVVIETEIWPHLIAATRKASVPLMMANATISPDSAARYRRGPAAALISPALAVFASILAVSEADRARFVALGVAHERVSVVGNLKYDRAMSPGLPAAAQSLRHDWQAENRPIWVAASTHADEESRLLPVYAALKKHWPDLLWILVPRHPQRFDEVTDLLAANGLRHVRRSHGVPVDGSVDVLLGDTLGELLLFYAAADVVFVGGTLVSGIGGHNIIEPAALGRVLALGPYAQSWADALAALDPRGACQLGDADALTHQLDQWLRQPEERARAGHANAECIRAHRGALAATLARLRPWLDAAPARPQ